MLKALGERDTIDSIRRVDVLLVCHDADRGHRYRERAYAPLIDTVGEQFERDGLTTATVATPYSRLGGGKAWGDPVTMNRRRIALAVKSRIERLFVGAAKARVRLDAAQTALWKRILDRAAPRAVIAINPEPALCRACHSAGIPVYDLQHGVIEGTGWYSEETNRNTASTELPSGFLCWDDAAAAVIRSWAEAKGARVHVVGNPWLQRFLKPAGSDALVREALSMLPAADDSRPTMLVTLQWGMRLIYGERAANGVMFDALAEAILETAREYRWLIRLHPVQVHGAEAPIAQRYLQSTFRHLPNVEWRRCSELPLPCLLGQADLHFTHHSSSTIEAALMGVPTALLSPFFAERGIHSPMFEQERQSGLAEPVAQDAHAIRRWIQRRLENRQSSEIGGVASSPVPLSQMIAGIAIR